MINDSEARLLSGHKELKRAAAAIRAMGPRILVIKRGEYGATLFYDGGYSNIPGVLLDTSEGSDRRRRLLSRAASSVIWRRAA